MFYQKLCETKFVDLFETTNFVFLRFFRIFVRTIVFKINRLENALAISKISFLRKFEKSYTCKKIFFVQKKNTCLFIVDKEPKKNYLVQICNIDCQSNME